MIVSLHAGHGGKDRGTMAGGVDEADYCLDFVLRLSQRINRLWPCSIMPYLVRDTDTRVPLTTAGKMAAEQHASLAFAIHVNAHHTQFPHGVRTFVRDSHPVAKTVAAAIMKAFPIQLSSQSAMNPFTITSTALQAQQWLHRPNNVLRAYSVHDIPAVLVELFFASNPTDYDYAHKQWVQQMMLLACCMGVAAFMEAKPHLDETTVAVQ